MIEIYFNNEYSHVCIFIQYGTTLFKFPCSDIDVHYIMVRCLNSLDSAWITVWVMVCDMTKYFFISLTSKGNNIIPNKINDSLLCSVVRYDRKYIVKNYTISRKCINGDF